MVGFQVNKLAAKRRKWRKCGKRTKRLQSAQMAVIAEMAQSAQSWRKKEQLLGRRAGIKKDGYLLPGLNQGARKRANITPPILHVPKSCGSALVTQRNGYYGNKITCNPIKFPTAAKKTCRLLRGLNLRPWPQPPPSRPIEPSIVVTAELQSVA